MKRLFLGLVGAAGLAAASLAQAPAAKADTSLLNASFDVGRELYADINPAFQAYWKSKAGEDVSIEQSHAGTSKQARSILEGMQADVVTFNQAPDIDTLVAGGAVQAGWEQKFPANASPYYSFPAFLVRAGNPKHIKDWSDLARDDVQVVFPNPKTSGNARYTYLAAYADALQRNGGDQAKAQEFVKTVFSHVPVFDTGGRGATTTFVERETGDVLITFEAETRGIAKQYGTDKYEVVVPQTSLKADFPVAVVDKVVDAKGTRKTAEAYLNFLYQPECQDIIARHFYRVNDEAVAKKYADQFPDVKLLTVDDVFGGWAKVNKEHFAKGGILDTLFVH
jgi:sulfate transport system substrate-binding protein